MFEKNRTITIAEGLRQALRQPLPLKSVVVASNPSGDTLTALVTLTRFPEYLRASVRHVVSERVCIDGLRDQILAAWEPHRIAEGVWDKMDAGVQPKTDSSQFGALSEAQKRVWAQQIHDAGKKSSLFASLLKDAS